jgi:cobalamin biosynthesis protein CobD/CbiB
VFSFCGSLETIRREAAHASPNAGYGGRHGYARRALGRDNFYGQCIHGPVFNASGRAAAAADIASSLVWMWRIAGMCAAAFIALSFALTFFPLT